MAGVRKDIRRGGKYQGWFIDYKGDRKYFTGTKRKAETLRIAEKLEDDHRQVRLGYRPIPNKADKFRNKHVSSIMREYLAWGKSQGGRNGRPWGKEHLRKRKSILEWWEERLDVEVMADLDGILATVEDILRELQLKKKSGKTLQNYAETLNSFCMWCVKRGFLRSNPLKDLAPFDTTPQTMRRAMARKEIVALFEVAPIERKLLYAVAFTTGLRAGELRMLTEKHIDVENKGLVLNAEWTKNRKPGFQPLPVSLIGSLKEFARQNVAVRLYEKYYDDLDEIPENPLLYVPSHPAREMDKDLKLARIPKTTANGKVDFHACRVAFITYILEAGASVKEAQVLARHSTPNLTMNTYARANDERLNTLTEMVADRLLNGSSDEPDTKENHKKCVICVSQDKSVPMKKNCKLLNNNNLQFPQGTGGGGIRTPVPRWFKPSVYIHSRFF